MNLWMVRYFFNHLNINEISANGFKKNCGVVMQDGFIFSDTIERNIATNDEKINYDKLNKPWKPLISNPL